MFCSYIHNTVVICPLTRSILPYMLVIFYNYIPLTSHNTNKGKSCSGLAPTPLALSHQQNQKLLRLPPPPPCADHPVALSAAYPFQQVHGGATWLSVNESWFGSFPIPHAVQNIICAFYSFPN